MSTPWLVRQVDGRDYTAVWHSMQQFTAERAADTPDEVWVTEHQPVYTLGQAGKREHLLNPSPEIPLVQIDRGGQVTYHGPGQLVIYTLLDLRRRKLGVRELVTQLEQAVIATLQDFGIESNSRREAPGVYVAGAKVAALGLRIKRGCSYHGLSLNVDMDLTPFDAINPCGYPGLAVTSLRRLGVETTLSSVTPILLQHLERGLSQAA